MCVDIRMRRARCADESALRVMQAASFGVLGRGYYPAGVIASFIRHVGTMDQALLDEGRYFVGSVEDEIVVCGGWSTHPPQYDGFAGQTARPLAEPVIRSVYVSPLVARLGLGRRMMAIVENDVGRAGFRAVQLTATLSGAPFYRRLGFSEGGRKELRLPDGAIFECVPMRKLLAQAADRIAA